MKKTSSKEVICAWFLEGPEGLEPSTRGLRGRCSNQLSYGPLNETNLKVFLIAQSAKAAPL
jgi:hypothetical protein